MTNRMCFKIREFVDMPLDLAPMNAHNMLLSVKVTCRGGRLARLHDVVIKAGRY